MKTIFTLGRWTLARWDRYAHWTLIPRRTTYWSGGLVHYQWLMLELIHDRRENWIADVLGLSGDGGKEQHGHQ